MQLARHAPVTRGGRMRLARFVTVNPDANHNNWPKFIEGTINQLQNKVYSRSTNKTQATGKGFETHRITHAEILARC